jgi:putative spermidine/putrescine transport system substrate-binding protein
MSTPSRTSTRRQVLRAGTAIAGAAAVGLPREAARAQAKGKIVVGTWGGDYARLLTKNVEDPILKAAGWEVVQDQAGDPQRRSKMQAEARLPRGTSDIQALSSVNMFLMNDSGLVAPVDYGKLKNAANLLPSMKYDYGVGHIYSGKVAVYNPKIISQAPTSYKTALDPKHGKNLAIIDIQYQYTMSAAALAAGGKVTAIEDGKKLLLEMKKAGMRIYPTNEAFAAALKAEEFGIGIMWKARVEQWQKAGIPVQAVTPSEGTLSFVSGFVIPKNAPNKDGAHAYIDAMLEKSAQENFAIDMGYNPTVTNAVVAPDLNKRIGFSPDEIKKLIALDYGFIAQNDVAMKDWWDKALKS